MKIGFDAFGAIGKGGNSTYTRQIIEHIVKLQPANKYFLFSFLHDIGRPQFLKSVAREVHSRLSASYFPLPYLEQINSTILSLHARFCGVEVFHFTNPLNFVDGPFKKVVTIHDLSPLYEKSWTKQHSGDLFRAKITHIAQKADAFIAVSEFTKKDMIERLGVSPEKITVIYEGASGEFYPDANKAPVQAIVGDSKYLLCVGALQPRKNNINLVRAFAKVAPQHSDPKLVFVGSGQEGYVAELKKVIDECNLASRIVFAKGIEDVALRSFYTHAECLVYPSLFEGFGLPVLESLQCGTPVITSNTSSLPEVAGDAGLLVDPNSVEDIAAAIEKYLSDPALQEKLRAAAIPQTKKFSWEKAARETLEIYEKTA